MLIQKILFSLTILLFTTTVFAQNKKLDNFFMKVQSKKTERLNEKLSSLNNETRKKVIDIIIKYDKKMFKIRKSSIHRNNKDFSCSSRINNIEDQLKTRKKIINLQLNKINELKALNLKCETLNKIIIFERKFMRKLRKKMKHGRHHGPNRSGY